MKCFGGCVVTCPFATKAVFSVLDLFHPVTDTFRIFRLRVDADVYYTQEKKDGSKCARRDHGRRGQYSQGSHHVDERPPQITKMTRYMRDTKFWIVSQSAATVSLATATKINRFHPIAHSFDAQQHISVNVSSNSSYS